MERLIVILTRAVAALTFIALSSCSEQGVDKSRSEAMTFGASYVSDVARTVLSNGTKVLWEDGDQIYVSGAEQPFTTSLSDPSTSAEFAGKAPVADVYYAVNPYSAVGYDFAIADSINSDYHYTKGYKGEGGFTQVYGGLSANICNWVALGVNAYYMFGEVKQTRGLNFTDASLDSVSQVDYLRASSLRLRYGLQLFHTFGKHSVTLGAVYENKQPFSRMEYKQIEVTTSDTVTTMTGGFEMPMMYGVGLSYGYDNRLTLGLDYQCQDWARASYFGKTKELLAKHSWALGMDYRNNPTSRKYVDRMLWRAGVNYATSYTLNYNQPELGVSLGVGFPLRTVGTVINTTLEYGRRGMGGNVLKENYLRFMVSASISEHWFFKRKL
jgi:hypothetical protein